MYIYGETFKRYINIDFWNNHYLEIIDTNFDFPPVLAYCHLKGYNKKIHDKSEKNKKSIPVSEIKYCENYDILRLIEFVELYPHFMNLLKPCALKYKTKVALIFSRPSKSWGLRGDPYFWQYLEEIFMNYEFPMDPDFFEEVIKKEFSKLTGKELGQEIFVEEFSHGGMSSGVVSSYWISVGIPLLKYRLIQSNNDYYLKNEEYSKIIENPKYVFPKDNSDFILKHYDLGEY